MGIWNKREDDTAVVVGTEIIEKALGRARTLSETECLLQAEAIHMTLGITMTDAMRTRNVGDLDEAILKAEALVGVLHAARERAFTLSGV
jgi:hypothetical protein